MSSQAHLEANFVGVEGSINLRDFGGYATADGARVRRGLLFRCGSLNHIPAQAFEDFAALDVGVICDLRSHEEAEESPTPATPPFDCRVHIPIWPGSSFQFQESINEAPPSLEDFIDFMRRITREIARDHVASYKQLMRELVNTERGFLLHCSAGKDRTGFGAAIILSLLGVNRETIIHDYLISNQATELAERMKEKMAERAAAEGMTLPMSDDILEVFAGVREEYLHGAFDEIDQHYGGIRGYFEAVGISAADESHLRERLLEA